MLFLIELFVARGLHLWVMDLFFVPLLHVLDLNKSISGIKKKPFVGWMVSPLAAAGSSVWAREAVLQTNYTAHATQFRSAPGSSLWAY